MNKKALLGVLAAGLLAGPMAAEAIPVTWTLEGTLLGNGTASGSFVYDADTGEFSNISLTTSFGRTYTQFFADLNTLDGLVFFQNGDPSGSDIAFLLESIHLSMLTNAGGVLLVNPGSVARFAEFRCYPDGCAGDWEVAIAVSNWDSRVVNTLTGVPTSVPEPGTLALFGLGLAGLGLTRRRRAA